MSKLPAGKYFIVNVANTSLALNYNGSGGDVVVVDFNEGPTQVWVVSDYDGNTQSVSPDIAKGLQIAKNNGVIATRPASDYVWTIKESQGVYTVQDGQQGDFWGLVVPDPGLPVTLGPGNGSNLQSWKFIPANPTD